MQNRESLRNTIRMLLGETSAVFWTDAMLNQWLEDGQLDIVYRTKSKRRTGYITTVADTMEYTLSTYMTDILDIGGPVRVYDGTNSKWCDSMDGMTRERMEDEYPNWESTDTSGEPTMYWYDVELNKFWVYQPPSSQYAGTNYLKVPYIAKPTVMSSDTTSPDIPEVLYPALQEWVVSKGRESRGYSDMAAQSMGNYMALVQSYNSIGKPKEDIDIIMKNYRR